VSKSSSGSSSASPSSGSSATKTRGSTRKRVSVPDAPGLARIIAIANQKGGVGKSTTAVSLGAALAELGFRILVVDLDPQGNASTGIGIRHDDRKVTSYDVIVAESPVTDAIVHSAIKGLDAVTSTIDLAGAEIELVSQFSREGRLKRSLEPVRDGSYDFIFLDCPPSLGLITINALTAAEELIVPIQCEYYALEGLGQLLRNVSLVQQNINPELRLTGIVMTMFDPRTRLSEQVVDEVRRFFGDLVYDNIIPRTVRLSEAPGFGVPITVYDPKSKGAQAYRDLAREVALRPPPETPMPAYDEMPTISVPHLADGPAAMGSSDEAEAPSSVEGVPHEEPTSEPAGAAVPAADEIERAAPDVVHAPAVAGHEETPAPRPEAGVSEAPEHRPAAETRVEAPPAPVEAPAAPVEVAQAPPEPDDEIWETPQPDSKVRPVPRPVSGSESDRRVVVIDEDAELGGGVPAPKAGGSVNERTESIGATLHDDDGQRRRWRLFRKGGD
jgi:chromosome partitioning protein